MPGSLEPFKDFYLVFPPLLVAMDPLAVLPFLVPFLGSIPRDRRRRVVNVSLLTGMGIGLFFLAHSVQRPLRPLTRRLESLLCMEVIRL